MIEVRETKESKEVEVKYENGASLVEEKRVLRRWTYYFEQFLNVDERGVTEISY